MRQKRPKFYAKTIQAALERARDAQGRIICEHCQNPITDDQQVSLHHVTPWAEVREELENNPVVRMLRNDPDIPSQPYNKAQKMAFNMQHKSDDELVPLHVACHREVDDGLRFSQAERERINRKHNDVQSKKMRVDHVKEQKAVNKPDIEAFSLKKHSKKLEEASKDELLAMRKDAEDALEDIQQSIENFKIPSSVIGERRVLAGRKFDRLVTTKHGICMRIHNIDEHVSWREKREEKARNEERDR